MHSIKWIFFALSILVLAWLAGCSSDDNPGNPNTTGFGGGDFPMPRTSVPQTIADSEDPGAMQVEDYADTFNDVQQSLQYLNPPNKGFVFTKQYEEPEIHEWDIGDLHVRLIIMNYEGMFHADVYLREGSVEEGEEWYALGADWDGDYSWVTVTVYEPDTFIGTYFSYSRNDDEGYDRFSVTDQVHEIVLKIYDDGNGVLTVTNIEDYINQWLVFMADWDSQGNGTWTEYNQNGDVVGTGILPEDT